MNVGLLGNGQAHLAHAEGSGLQGGTVGQVESFNIYTGQVGGGELSVSVDGPSRATVAIQDLGDSNCHVAYTVTEPGLYAIDVKFDDAHITGSPFKVGRQQSACLDAQMVCIFRCSSALTPVPALSIMPVKERETPPNIQPRHLSSGVRRVRR